MADLDETKSAPMAEVTQMNLAVLGSVGGVGVKVCEPQATKMKQQQMAGKKSPFLASRWQIWMKQRALPWLRRRRK
jgi:hypothetical protein